MPRTLKTGLPQRRPLVLHSASDVRPWTHDYVSLQPPPNPGGVPTFLRLLQVGKHMQDRLTQTPTREGTVLYESVAVQTPMTLATLRSLEEDAADLTAALQQADAALADAAAAHAAEIERQRESHDAELSRVCEAAAEDGREDSARLQAAVADLEEQLADRDDIIRQLTDQLMATEEPTVDAPDSEASEEAPSERGSRRSSGAAVPATPAADEGPARLFEEPGAASDSIRRLVEAESFGGGSAGSDAGSSRGARRVGAASVVARIELLRAERELERLREAHEVRRSAEVRLQEEQRGVARERAEVARARAETEEWAARTVVAAEAQETLHEVLSKEVRARCAAGYFVAAHREPSGTPVDAPAQPAPSGAEDAAASPSGASEASAGGPHAAAQTQGGVTPEDCRAHGFAQLKRGAFRKRNAVQKVKMRSALKPSFRSCRDETPLFTLEFTNYDKSLFEPAGDSAAGSDGSPGRPRPRSAQVVRSSTVCGKPLFQRRSHLLCTPVSAAYG